MDKKLFLAQGWVFIYLVLPMIRRYNTDLLLEALHFNAQEVLPADSEKMHREVERVVEAATKSGQVLRQYIGFEISGEIHIGTGLMSALKIKKFTEAGVECVLFLADYHTFLNENLDGNLDSIRRVAREYFGPVLLECCRLVGCDMRLVSVVFAEEAYAKTPDNHSFWDYDMHVARHITQARVLKSISIAGRGEGETVSFATMRYPVMQTADAYFLQTHFVCAGLDQRKCHVLMREVAYALPEKYRLKIGDKDIKPIASHYHLLHGLGKPVDGQVAKMSKSKPDTCIFVYDFPEEITRKLKKAYCPLPDPEKSREENLAEQTLNPLLDWCRKMLFPAGRTLEVRRLEKFGGDKDYVDYATLERDYLAGELHPGDFKPAVARNLAEWLAPLQTYVKAHPEGLNFLRSVQKK